MVYGKWWRPALPTKLDQVQIIPRRLISDERGWFLKVIDGKEPSLPAATGEIYLTYALPGQARGNHYHKLASEWFTVVLGEARLILADLETGERRELQLSATKPTTVFVPAGIGHVFINPPEAPEPMLLIAYADTLYDPVDTIMMELR
jgi:dTDP-4-dehydrorhamnose 3,5-epimerase-like enzyme